MDLWQFRQQGVDCHVLCASPRRLLAVTGFLHLILDQLQAAAAAADPAAAAMGLSQTLSQAGTSQVRLNDCML